MVQALIQVGQGVLTCGFAVCQLALAVSMARSFHPRNIPEKKLPQIGLASLSDHFGELLVVGREKTHKGLDFAVVSLVARAILPHPWLRLPKKLPSVVAGHGAVWLGAQRLRVDAQIKLVNLRLASHKHLVERYSKD